MYETIDGNNDVVYIDDNIDKINSFISFLIEDDIKNKKVNNYTVVNK